MQQQNLFDPVPVERLQMQTKEDLILFIKLQQDVNNQLRKRVEYLEALGRELKNRTLFVQDRYIVLKNKLFGKSSERSASEAQEDSAQPSKPKRRRIQLPSQRYPDAPLIERSVEFQTMPSCSCCGSEMIDSGMTEDSEYLTVIPKQYLIVRQKRQKVRCGKCHGDIQTAPAPERIKEGSSYSDEMMVDVALSKYLDLIPVERYASMAAREGFKDLPPQSLIESTHYVAEFVEKAYDRLRAEIIDSKVLHADETPHRMLEGDKKSNWFLWGFSNQKTSFFEYHDTRSGTVASRLLASSGCEYLVSDVFSGYGKAVKDTNIIRQEKKLPLIQNVYCNAHARRKFIEAEEGAPEEASFFIEQYRQIYHREAEAQGKPSQEILEIRQSMKAHFDEMKKRAMAHLVKYSSKSMIARAMTYFLENYKELTLFLQNSELPIDNNPQERLLRNPVIGRKTWYGTHSKQGAKTAAVLFSLVESCKLNGMNPRDYFRALIQDLHAGKAAYSPAEFATKTDPPAG